MSKKTKITQQAFDDVVRENQDEFEMKMEEAIADALEQFRSQGADISRIITKPKISIDGRYEHAVLAHLKELKGKSGADAVSGLEQLTLDLEDSPSRALAAEKHALTAIIAIIDQYVDDAGVVVAGFKALGGLLTGQPDQLLPSGIPKDNVPEVEPNPIIESLIQRVDGLKGSADGLRVGLSALRQGCVMHELNRQAFIKHGIVDLLMFALDHFPDNADIVSEVAHFIRTLILDDDIRVPFGKAHEHAKFIVTQGQAIKKLLAAFKVQSSWEVQSELCLSIGRLAVRNEFCEEIVSNEGLELITSAMRSHPTSVPLLVNALIAIKLIAGNDDVKNLINRSGTIELIIQTMQKHLLNPDVAEQGSCALGAVSLRNVTNAEDIVSLSGGNVLVKLLNVHHNNASILKQASSAIRNIVSRSPHLREGLLGEGAEHFLREAMKNHKSCEEAAKAALRDLGCDIELKVLWAGTGRNLERD